MKPAQVIEALAALAHEHRLAIYRALVEEGPEGLPAGQIADRVGLAPSSLTFHLQHLTRAGMIRQQRSGRQLIYSSDFTAMNELVGYLTENCCRGATACSATCAPAQQQTSRNRKRKSA